MNTYKILLSYSGLGFEGWQIQPKGHKTIQGELNKALEKICKSKEVQTLGSGRTDSGVHAVGQVVRLAIPIEIEPNALKRALNSHLPAAIRVLKCEEISADFHPVRDVRWKEYQYFLFCGEVLPPVKAGHWTHCIYNLDLDKMRQAIKAFEGRHDFINFSTKGTEVSSTVREIFSCNIECLTPELETGPWGEGQLIKFSFVGEGFLKQMVRLLVGTLINAGRGKVVKGDIEEFLVSAKETKLAAVAPPDGLYLKHVEYHKDWPLDD